MYVVMREGWNLYVVMGEEKPIYMHVYGDGGEERKARAKERKERKGMGRDGKGARSR